MKKFKEYLIELFDRPVKWRINKSLSDNNIFTYTFEITPYKYQVSLDLFKTDLDVEFWIEYPDKKQSRAITNTRNEIQVFSTVLDIIKSFIKEHSEITKIEFSATKQNIAIADSDAKNSRGALYSRMVKKYIPKDWQFVIKEKNTYFLFVITKK